MCQKTLSAFYEIDHIIRVADGGSNHISNLRALCPECHRRKTAFEGGGGGAI
jgi:5-methylcytosine-specific restriction endonuclease McrA